MPSVGREGNPGLHSCWCQEVLPESNPDAPHCLHSVFCGGTRLLQLTVPVPKLGVTEGRKPQEGSKWTR